MKPYYKYIVILSFIISSCAYNKKDLPQPINPTASDSITYTSHIKTLIENNQCLNCHTPGGSASFRDYTSYSGIKAVAVSGALKNRAIDGGAPTMPLNLPELSPTTKDTLLFWINQGAKQ